MLQSTLFGKTSKQAPSEFKLTSHILLNRGGFVRESSAGRYYFLPLGWRVHEKIRAIIKEEMDKTGAQEMITPVLHPIELWKETNRTNTAGFELMKIKDRRGAEFALGGTAEEMFVDVVRGFQLSYKDLPFNVYQFSAKFRDELRARGGLLRVREFVMKDAYSFHADEQDFKREYLLMAETYSKIFERMGLRTIQVEAGNGYIGGEYSHEFQSPCESGEDTIFIAQKAKKAFNQELAPSLASPVVYEEKPQPKKDVLGKGIVGVEELAKFLSIPVEKTTKTLLFKVDDERIIAAAVRGGYDVNLEKLKKVVGAHLLELADEKTVKKITGADIGYAGILGLSSSVEMFIDESCDKRVNFETGANKTHYHTINVNWDRDIKRPKEFCDIKVAKEGDMYPASQEKYQVLHSIEVGNIFQLGYHYSSLMKGAQFVDRTGKMKNYYMGCYGIGLGRTMAAIVEAHHDKRGIVWPEEIAPFEVHLLVFSGAEKQSEEVYMQLNDAGIDVLWDDRDESAGKKLADADLLGIPVRLIISEKTLRQGSGQAVFVEWKRRDGDDFEILKIEEVIDRLRKKK